MAIYLKELKMAEIPPGLKKRWEKFAEASRKCWDEVEKQDSKLPPEERFKRFWKCMDVEAAKDPNNPVELTQEEIRECLKRGILAPHPICVLAKTAEGKSITEAHKECLEEGKFHGISKIHCKAVLEGTL